MTKKIVLSIIMTFCFMMIGCVLSQEKGKSKNNYDAISGSETQKLIAGTWKITSVHCDNKGANCEGYKVKRIFQFGKNGELVINNVKRGSFRVAGSSCILDTGTRQYTVNIIFIDSSKLITGESHRTTSEIFTRVR